MYSVKVVSHDMVWVRYGSRVSQQTGSEDQRWGMQRRRRAAFGPGLTGVLFTHYVVPYY